VKRVPFGRKKKQLRRLQEKEKFTSERGGGPEGLKREPSRLDIRRRITSEWEKGISMKLETTSYPKIPHHEKGGRGLFRNKGRTGGARSEGRELL